MRSRCRGPFPDDWTEDHGDRLFSEGRTTEVMSPHIGILLGLLLLCLIPRVWAGTLHDILCPDTVSYVRWTNALEAGNLVTAFKYTGINIYPPLLLGLKALPGDWLAAAKWWSVAMATLAILPIYGWLRRQFNETLAIIGCGFYALHPAMIHDSPLVVRDPTFWLLFALGLYIGWRAVSELRYRWFVAFAVIFGLMIHLRTEGWLLAPVLFVWVAFRLRHTPGKRVLIATTALLALAAGPVSGLLAQKALLAQDEEQISGDARHMDRVGRLVDSTRTVSITAIANGTRKIVVRYAKAFGYLPLVLAIAGIAHWQLRLLGPSKGPLLLFCLLSFAAVWATFCLIGMDRRYAFPSIIVSLPTIAAGLCLTATWCTDAANRSRQLHRRDFSFWLLCLMSASSLVLSVTIVASPRPLQYDQAEIGRWIHTNVGPDQEIAVNLVWTRLVEHYGDCRVVRRTHSGGSRDPDCAWFAERKPLPSVILIWLDWRNPAGRRPFEPDILAAKELGYREVPANELPDVCRQILVLVHDDPD
jgi:dolichyl-phosphate-mannose-protein mannosyltransferase